MTGAELAPLELAGRLALAFGLAVFLGLAFEEVYKREDRSSPGGVRTFPMLAVSGAMLYLIESQRALAFIAGLLALAPWLHAYLRNALPVPNSTRLMIPVSNLLAYLIGPVALTQPPCSLPFPSQKFRTNITVRSSNPQRRSYTTPFGQHAPSRQHCLASLLR